MIENIEMNDYCEYCLMIKPCDCDLDDYPEDHTDMICPSCGDPDCNRPWSHE